MKIKSEKCKGCTLCIGECPTGALKISKKFNNKGFNYPIIDENKCNNCGLCYIICPDLIFQKNNF